MLKASKSSLFENMFALYNRNLFKRHFHSFKVSGLEYLNQRSQEIPLIIYANHSSWWDGLVAFQISREAKLDAFVMMEEKQLRRFFLFRFLGAFSVVRDKPREALESIHYASKLLRKNPQHALWIFPQGKILPNDQRPIYFYNGLSRIIERVGPCTVASLSIRYEFLNEFKPEIFVKIGKPEKFAVGSDFKSKHLTNLLAENLLLSLDELKVEIANQNTQNYLRII